MVLRKRDDGSKEEALQEGAPLVGGSGSGSGGAAKPGGRVAHYTGTCWPGEQGNVGWMMPHLVSVACPIGWLRRCAPPRPPLPSLAAAAQPDRISDACLTGVRWNARPGAGHMTIYVLVVALVSATGGMLFG